MKIDITIILKTFDKAIAEKELVELGRKGGEEATKGCDQTSNLLHIIVIVRVVINDNTNIVITRKSRAVIKPPTC